MTSTLDFHHVFVNRRFILPLIMHSVSIPKIPLWLILVFKILWLIFEKIKKHVWLLPHQNILLVEEHLECLLRIPSFKLYVNEAARQLTTGRSPASLPLFRKSRYQFFSSFRIRWRHAPSPSSFGSSYCSFFKNLKLANSKLRVRSFWKNRDNVKNPL